MPKGSSGLSEESQRKLTAKEAGYGITQQEIDDAMWYTEGGFTNINKYLRGELKLSDLDKEESKALRAVESIMNKSPNLKEGTVLYRGTSLKSLNLDNINIPGLKLSDYDNKILRNVFSGTTQKNFEKIRKTLIGSNYVNKGYSSTSTEFIVTEYFKTGLNVKITVGKNAKGLDVNKRIRKTVEKEVILPRNAKLKVVDVTREKISGKRNQYGDITIHVKYGD